MIGDYPLLHGDNFEKRNSSHIQDPQTVEFRQRMEKVLWIVKSKLFAMQSTTNATSSRTQMMDIGRMVKSVREEVDT